MSADGIHSTLNEERLFEPPSSFSERAALSAEHLQALYEAAEKDHVGFWAGLAKESIAWHKPFTVALDDSKAPHYRWFTDGELNISYNCIDRHLADKGDKTAIIFETEAGEVSHISYREL
ncbi:MAG: acetyl-coenzyme A synthetase, partial [Myxococcales bacterium]|nr:acetyl-coenzyme A synthetase [Myxococcales bacterium]